jgi:hypothetical protein
VRPEIIAGGVVPNSAQEPSAYTIDDHLSSEIPAGCAPPLLRCRFPASPIAMLSLLLCLTPL